MQVLLDTLAQRLAQANRPFLVALDGRSGTGKSTLAGHLVTTFNAALVPVDDFFAASIPDSTWDTRTPVQRVADAVDWQRLRSEALEPLRAGREAAWHPFDFAAGLSPEGTYPFCSQATVAPPRPLVVVEGAYSTRPELRDLLDLTVLVEVPDGVRRRRLAARKDQSFQARWHLRWDPAEDYYFGMLRPREAFDVTLSGE